MVAKIVLGFMVVTVLLVALAGVVAYDQGYRAALHDYTVGNIDCIIRVQYPDLLEKK